MTIDRAIEILNPKRRKHYYNIGLVNEACYMGMDALLKQKPQRPKINLWDKWLECPKCGEILSDEEGMPLGDGATIQYCFGCGQAIDWEEDNAID